MKNREKADKKWNLNENVHHPVQNPLKLTKTQPRTTWKKTAEKKNKQNKNIHSVECFWFALISFWTIFHFQFEFSDWIWFMWMWKICIRGHFILIGGDCGFWFYLLYGLIWDNMVDGDGFWGRLFDVGLNWLSVVNICLNNSVFFLKPTMSSNIGDIPSIA